MEISKAVFDGLRQHDPERLLAVANWPKTVQARVAPVLALYVELSRIRFMVREPLMGQLRLAFWRERLPQVAQGRGLHEHPLFPSLYEFIKNQQPDLAQLDELISIREAELLGSEQDFIELQTKACALLLQLMQQAGGLGHIAAYEGAALAKAMALVEVMQHFPHWQQKLEPVPPVAGLMVALQQALEQVSRRKWPRPLRRLFNIELQARLYLRWLMQNQADTQGLEAARLRHGHPTQALRLYLDRLFN